MINTELLSQGLAIIANGIHANSIATGTTATSSVDLSKVRQTLFIVDVGTIGASATVAFQVTGSSTSGGTFTAITGTSITTISASSKYAMVCVRTEQVAALGLGYAWIQGSLVVGTAATGASVLVLAAIDRYEPASNFNTSAVATPIVL